MIKWNGHVLDYLRVDSDIYFCENCKVRLFYDETEYSEFNYIDKQWSKYYLSCEEQIIKNIIE